ncbi:MAG: GNAT family N-acetyltransferase [Solirubrobacterales bacterium]
MRVRAPRDSDGPAYVELFLRPEIQRWLRPQPLPPFGAAEIEQMLSEDLQHWEEFEFGPWALVEEGSESLLGRAGLRWTAIQGKMVVELAWTTDPDHQGTGLATEAALAALDLARSLGITEVVALTLPGNLASRRVAEKAGLRPDGGVEHAGLAHILYRKPLA